MSVEKGKEKEEFKSDMRCKTEEILYRCETADNLEKILRHTDKMK